MSYSELSNPYDFANPVTEEKLFAGRSDELKEIRYYLNHGAKTNKPINLSLIGDRAAGKTSLLNMIEIEASKLNFLTVRIDLDEGDKESQLQFFYKIFDSIFNSAINDNYFGGVGGAIFDEYLNQTSAYTVSNNIEFRPFLFPIQFAKAMDAGRTDVLTSESNFKRDLETINKEVNKSIILLFDECNVLSESRVLLEKIRNIFMNKTNYMLVFTGTKELFPVIDEIFSPIIRQFKKITVDEYKDIEDTEICVSKPLLDIGIEPSDIFENSTFRELHNISEGKPYEIQLICHNMFKKIQEGITDSMTLNHSVLEDVRLELETSQDLAKRPKLYEIKSFNKESLQHLNYLSKSLKRSTSTEILNLEYLIYGNTRVTKADFKTSYDKFIDKGILFINPEGRLDFFGDDFDKLYTKYYAREAGVQFEFNYYNLESNYYRGIRDLLHPTNSHLSLNRDNDLVHQTIDYFLNKTATINADLSTVMTIYTILFQFRKDEIIHIEMPFNLNGTNFFIHLFFDDKDAAKKVVDFQNEFEKRVKDNGTNITLNSLIINKLQIPSRVELVKKIQALHSNSITKDVIKYHGVRFPIEHIESLLEENDERENIVLAHCNAIWELDFNGKRQFCSIENYNVVNMGYIYMINLLLEEAKYCSDFVTSSLEYNKFHLSLNTFNRSVIEIMTGNLNAIQTNMDRVITLAKDYQESTNTVDSTSCSCLLIPSRTGDGDITFIEVENPELIQTALDVKAYFKSFKI